MRNLFLLLCLIVAIFYASDWFWKPLLGVGKKEPPAAPPPVVSVAPLSERKDKGTVVQYFDNGNLKAERHFKDGKLDGPYKIFYENGQLKLEGSYRNDQMNGVFKRYNPQGQLVSEEVYEDNVPISRKIPPAAQTP